MLDLKTRFLLAAFPIFMLGRPLYRRWERKAAEAAGYAQPRPPWPSDGVWAEVDSLRDPW